jgi:hypothetical protein
MSALVPVSLHLSKAQVRKAAQGRPIQISADNLHEVIFVFEIVLVNRKFEIKGQLSDQMWKR